MNDLLSALANGESLKIEHAVSKEGAAYLGLTILLAMILGFALGAIILKNV